MYKFEINDRVIVKGNTVMSDDTFITHRKTYEKGDEVEYYGIATKVNQQIFVYQVDEFPGLWIDQDFIFPWQQGVGSFDKMMARINMPNRTVADVLS